MRDFDLVIRNGTVATAADDFEADVGVKDGNFRPYSHCHIEQMTSSGAGTADDFASGARSAAAGGTTSVVCFSAQAKGGTIAANLGDHHP